MIYETTSFLDFDISPVLWSYGAIAEVPQSRGLAESVRLGLSQRSGDDSNRTVSYKRRCQHLLAINFLCNVSLSPSFQQLNASADGNSSSPEYSHEPGTVLTGGYHTITVTFSEDENYMQASKTVVIKVNYEYSAYL